MFDHGIHQPASLDPSFNLFERSFSRKLKEANFLITANNKATEEAQDVVESLSRLSPSILIGPSQGHYIPAFQSTTSPNAQATGEIESSYTHTTGDGEASYQYADTPDRRKVSQERNRLAAVKSRLKKKQEWSRLVDSERFLREENEFLRARIKQLEDIVNQLSARVGMRLE